MKNDNSNLKLIIGFIAGMLICGTTIICTNLLIQNNQRKVSNLSGTDIDYEVNKNTVILENDIIHEIITKAEEQLGKTDLSDEQEGRKVKKAYVRSIQIADDIYINTLYDAKINGRGDSSYGPDGYLENGHVDYEGAYNYMANNPEAKFPIYGSITFMIEYEKDFEGSWAGNGPAYYTGRYAIGDRIFTYENGVLSFGTGGSKEYEEYKNLRTEKTIGKIIDKIDASTIEDEVYYLLTDKGELYFSCTEKADKINDDYQYTKLDGIPGFVTDFWLDYNDGFIICKLKNGEIVYLENRKGKYTYVHKYYPFISVEYPFVKYSKEGKDLVLYFTDDKKLYFEDGLGEENTFKINGSYMVSENVVTCKLESVELMDGRVSTIDGILVLKFDESKWKFNVLDWEYNTNRIPPSYMDAYFYTDFIHVGDEFFGATV